jgi:hypothetical protein
VIDQGVIVLGVPIPSSSPLFLSIVALHVVAGLVCVFAGIVAMFSIKGPGRHPSAGAGYFWSLLVACLTMAALSMLRWPEDTHLFVLGILSFGAGVIGRMARRRHSPGLLPVHVTAMAVSLWRSLPTLAHWLLPSLVGFPVLAWTLRRHPLLRCSRALP